MTSSPFTTPHTSTKKFTQKEAVRQALAAGATHPAAGVRYVKDTFDIQLTNQSFSTLKSQLKKAAEITGMSLDRPPVSFSGPVVRVVEMRKATNPADLAATIKALVRQHGAEVVKQMVDVFAE